MKRRGGVEIVLLAAFMLAGPAAAQDSIAGQARVIDGDTIIIHGLRIRLQGIDTPERYQRCRDARDRVYRCGDTATEALRRAIGSSAVRCDLEAQRDRYGRAIGTCYGWDTAATSTGCWSGAVTRWRTGAIRGATLTMRGGRGSSSWGCTPGATSPLGTGVSGRGWTEALPAETLDLTGFLR